MIAEVMPSQSPRPRSVSRGHTKPRLAPPLPLKSDVRAFREEAKRMGLTLIPWQEVGARYLEARRPDGLRLYREIAFQIARQNGKTTLVKPFISKALRAGLRVMHIAQSRELPRDMFDSLASSLSDEPELFPKRRGKVIWPRYGAGQEEIKLNNGGRYRIAAARSGGARGWSNDILIIDECREMESNEIIDAALPTTTASADPLVIYLSNAGTDQSIVLNSLRLRAENGDPNLAFLEWSASPERDAGDRRGWAEANPSLGYLPGLAQTLEAAYTRAVMSGNMGGFETEHLSRSVPTLMPRVVADIAWQRARGTLTEPARPAMGVKVDPEGRRASAVIAWMTDGRIYVRSFVEDISAPLNVDALAEELKPLAKKHHVSDIGYDPWTDRDLARNLTGTQAINGGDYQAACERFVRAVEGGQLIHDDDGTIGGDLAYTVRREVPNGWLATRADAERPTTSVEAAIRAVWLATKPAPPKPRVF